MEWKKINPVFWLSSGNLNAYASFLDRWYQYAKTLLEWPAKQLDVDVADLFIVDLLAWERDIERFSGEPEWLYRRRVKFAYHNVKDAGSAQGFKRIWERMELGYINIEERIPGRDWDVVKLTVTDHALSQYPELINVILSHYAITCRRYELTTLAIDVATVRINHFEHVSQNILAKLS